MDTIEKEKLLKSLAEEEKTILSELNELSRENPKAEGDFHVPYINEGDSMDENAREIMEFERTNIIVENLKKRLKDIKDTVEKIKNDSYGQCEKCAIKISTGRLKANTVAKLCINCAKISSREV